MCQTEWVMKLCSPCWITSYFEVALLFHMLLVWSESSKLYPIHEKSNFTHDHMAILSTPLERAVLESHLPLSQRRRQAHLNNFRNQFSYMLKLHTPYIFGECLIRCCNCSRTLRSALFLTDYCTILQYFVPDHI